MDYTYPSCLGIAENGCSWTQCTDDDIDFAVELVETVSKNVCVDSDRIYAVGGSNGGMFVWDLARHESSAEVFSAIASLIGMPHRGYLDPPIFDQKMAAILITGMNDRTSPPGEWGQRAFTTTSDGDYFYYTGATAITGHGLRRIVVIHLCRQTNSTSGSRMWNVARGLTATLIPNGHRFWTAGTK